MTLAPATYRGQPLVALMLLLGGWVAVRAMVWDAAAEPSHGPSTALAGAEMGRGHAGPRSPAIASPAPGTADEAPLDPAPPGPSFALRPAVPLAGPVPVPVPASALARPAVPAFVPRAIMPGAPPVQMPPLDRVAVAAGHNLLWMAAVSRMPLLTAQMAAAQASDQAPPGTLVVDPVPETRAIRLASRWSADAWLMLREGGKSSLAGSGIAGTTGRPSYGASQAGAVLRYRLAPGSPLRPVAYLQAATAVGGVRDREVAAGLSVRPISGLPVSVAGELRARDEPGGLRARPAVIAITELPYFALPLGARMETYVQAGYVGGRGHTAFVDGQVRVDRAVKALGRAELRAGAGIWGGAQKGAARFDIGPAASVGFPLNQRTYARVAVDWRLRVAGEAKPASGPALTLSAGF